MEKMQLSLRNLIEDYSKLPMNKTATVLNDVCLGLQYLHSRTPPIVHRDLTPNNILLCRHLRAKISDLGVATTLETTDTTLTQIPGTLDFMAPECLGDNPVYGLPLDIFSFGGVILYITTQKWPHPASWIRFDPDSGEKVTLTSELQRRQQYLDKMTGAYAKFKPLAISCLDDNPKNRPTVVELLAEIKKVKTAFSDDVVLYCDISIPSKQLKVTNDQSQKQLSQNQQTVQKQQQQKEEQQNQGQKYQQKKQQQIHKLNQKEDQEALQHQEEHPHQPLQVIIQCTLL